MSIPDFLIWNCAGCGAAAEGKKKPCDCATNVGTRAGPNGGREQTWWDDAASPVSPDAEAIVRRMEAERHKPFGQRLRSSIIDALTAYATREREAATIRAIEFVEGGRFLHDDAPPKRFALECAGEMRKQLLEPICAERAQSKEGK